MERQKKAKNETRSPRLTAALVSSLLLHGIAFEVVRRHQMEADTTTQEKNAELLQSFQADRDEQMTELLDEAKDGGMPSPRELIQLDALQRKLDMAKALSSRQELNLDELDQETKTYEAELQQELDRRMELVIQNPNLAWTGDVRKDFATVQAALLTEENRYFNSDFTPQTLYQRDQATVSDQLYSNQVNCQVSRMTPWVLERVYEAKGLPADDLDHLKTINWKDHLASAYVDEDGNVYQLQELSLGEPLVSGRESIHTQQSGEILPLAAHLTVYVDDLGPTDLHKEKIEELGLSRDKLPRFMEEEVPNDVLSLREFEAASWTSQENQTEGETEQEMATKAKADFINQIKKYLESRKGYGYAVQESAGVQVFEAPEWVENEAFVEALIENAPQIFSYGQGQTEWYVVNTLRLFDETPPGQQALEQRLYESIAEGIPDSAEEIFDRGYYLEATRAGVLSAKIEALRKKGPEAVKQFEQDWKGLYAEILQKTKDDTAVPPTELYVYQQMSDFFVHELGLDASLAAHGTEVQQFIDASEFKHTIELTSVEEIKTADEATLQAMIDYYLKYPERFPSNGYYTWEVRMNVFLSRFEDKPEIILRLLSEVPITDESAPQLLRAVEKCLSKHPETGPAFLQALEKEFTGVGIDVFSKARKKFPLVGELLDAGQVKEKITMPRNLSKFEQYIFVGEKEMDERPLTLEDFKSEGNSSFVHQWPYQEPKIEKKVAELYLHTPQQADRFSILRVLGQFERPLIPKELLFPEDLAKIDGLPWEVQGSVNAGGLPMVELKLLYGTQVPPLREFRGGLSYERILEQNFPLAMQEYSEIEGILQPDRANPNGS